MAKEKSKHRLYTFFCLHLMFINTYIHTYVFTERDQIERLSRVVCMSYYIGYGRQEILLTFVV